MGARATVQQAVRTPEVEAWTSAQLTLLSASLDNPAGWAMFIHQSFRRAREDGRELLALRRSLRVWMLVCSAALVFWRAGVTRRIPPPAAFGWVLGTSLLAEWHLGMIPTRDDPSPTRLALPNRLTLLRVLLPAAVVGIPRGEGRDIRGSVALAGLLSDLLDGYLARSTQAQSHFGTVADPLADAALWITLATTTRSGRIGRVLAWLTALRYGTPIAFALVVTFGRGITYDWHPRRIGRWSSALMGALLTVREIRGGVMSRKTSRNRCSRSN